MAKSVLGKGLNALLPELAETKKVMEIDVNELTANPYQPRTVFAEEAIASLADSLKEYGMVQPIVVVKREGKYQIVAGERRWRAAKKLNWAKVPAIVQDYSEAKMIEVALIENLEREDLNPIETAECYQKLLDDLGYTQENLASKIGRSRTAITNSLRLLKLPEEIKEYVSRETLSSGHGRAILGLEDEAKQIELAKRAIEEGLSVRQVEELVKNDPVKAKKEKKAKPALPPEYEAIEGRLKSFFGTKVAIHQGKKKGRIEIEYYSEDDLERILETLALPEE